MFDFELDLLKHLSLSWVLMTMQLLKDICNITFLPSRPRHKTMARFFDLWER